MGLLGKAIADADAVAIAFSVAAEIEAAALKGIVVTTVAFVVAVVLAVTGFVATTVVGTVVTVPAAGAFVRDLVAVQFVVETVSLVVGMSCAMNFYY